MSADDWIDLLLPAATIEMLVHDRVCVTMPGCPGCYGIGGTADEAFSLLVSAMTRFYQMEVGEGRPLPKASDLPGLQKYWAQEVRKFEARAIERRSA